MQTPQASFASSHRSSGTRRSRPRHRRRPGLEFLEGRALPSFLVPFSYELPGAAFSLITADFNNDGVLDLAAGVYSQGTVSLHLGRGDGTFETGRLNRVPGGVEALVAGDFNTDGNADLAIASQPYVSVLLGDGQGGFSNAGTFPAGNRPRAVDAADLNRDGHLDLAVVNLFSGDASVLLGIGDGTFQSVGSYPVGRFPQAVTIGDVNADEALDLVVANEGQPNGTVVVLFGAGDGSFSPGGTYASGTRTSSVVLEDLNGDGVRDLAVANQGRDGVWDGTVGLLFGRGDGTFADVVQFPAGLGTTYVTATDLNGDGLPDLAVANRGVNTEGRRASVRAFFNAGDGTFTGGPHYYLGWRTGAVAVGDFDANGIVDLAAPNSASGGLSVLRGLGDGAFLDAPTYAVGRSPNAVVTADFNEDGSLDLVTAGYNNGSEVSLLLGNGDGSFQPAYGVLTERFVYQLATGDLDGDGHLDLVVAGQRVYVLFGQGDGSFANGPSYEFAGAVTLADFNADGLLDFAVMAWGEPGTIRVWLSLGDRSFELAGTFLVGPNPATKRLTAGDFDGDGLLDLLIYINSYPPGFPNRGYHILNGNGDGTFQPARLVGNEYGAFFRATGDFNADGIADYIGQDRASVRVYLGNGDGSYRYGRYDYATASPTRDLAVGDFNADGYPDMAVVREDHDNVLILLNTGDGAAPGPGGSGAGPGAVTAAALAAEGAPRAPAPTHAAASRKLSAAPPLSAAQQVRPSPQTVRDQVFARLRAPRFSGGAMADLFDLNGQLEGAARQPFAR